MIEEKEEEKGRIPSILNEMPMAPSSARNPQVACRVPLRTIRTAEHRNPEASSIRIVTAHPIPTTTAAEYKNFQHLSTENPPAAILRAPDNTPLYTQALPTMPAESKPETATKFARLIHNRTKLQNQEPNSSPTNFQNFYSIDLDYSLSTHQIAPAGLAPQLLLLPDHRN